MGGDVEEVARLKIRHLIKELESAPAGNDQVELIPIMGLLLVHQMRLIDFDRQQWVFKKRKKFLP